MEMYFRQNELVIPLCVHPMSDVRDLFVSPRTPQDVIIMTIDLTMHNALLMACIG